MEFDRKSTRLNSSHTLISYAVFCLKKKPTSSPPASRTHPAGRCPCLPATPPARGRLGSALFFFFKDTATTEIYPLSLHDALPILNSSHTLISYAVFCLRDESVTGV